MSNSSNQLGTIIHDFRVAKRISQEVLAERAGIHRTYVSQIERGMKSPTIVVLQRIAQALDIRASEILMKMEKSSGMYLVRQDFSICPGFRVYGAHVKDSTVRTNATLASLPEALYRYIDLKTVSAIIGATFCTMLANETGSIVNPIEKGHPDIVPLRASKATEEQLRNYAVGLEVKSTVGNVRKGSNLRAGQQRLQQLSGITWQAHHREVTELLGIVWDFLSQKNSFRFPTITGIFYASNLHTEDWGAISGTSGRNTKVSGMRVSGKKKMGKGWVLAIDNQDYIAKFEQVLAIDDGSLRKDAS